MYANKTTDLSDLINSFIKKCEGKNNFKIISIQSGGIAIDSDDWSIEPALIVYEIDEPKERPTFKCPVCSKINDVLCRGLS